MGHKLQRKCKRNNSSWFHHLNVCPVSDNVSTCNLTCLIFQTEHRYSFGIVTVTLRAALIQTLLLRGLTAARNLFRIAPTKTFLGTTEVLRKWNMGILTVLVPFTWQPVSMFSENISLLFYILCRNCLPTWMNTAENKYLSVSTQWTSVLIRLFFISL